MSGKVFRYGFMWGAGESPDLGTIDFVRKDENGLYEYVGLSSDVQYLGNLPKAIPSGSTFMALDTSDVYEYLQTTEQWYEL